ncbi:hypothetical protein CKO_04292 [Citrobacter koseri ATCC BAA-895]|uniref:Uncharacterized protein n=1 Tax=Citrobacter koseri (strain ATCC BAA-895 / CDC 4225-83 / SGSC4696) TaxID=290338 RepID=A8APD6_CITK8|nr:hypothetical protein CKO_04292 [Citrobacter koseri ATCC BAA-895]
MRFDVLTEATLSREKSISFEQNHTKSIVINSWELTTALLKKV